MVDYDLYLSDEEAEDDAELTDVPGVSSATVHQPELELIRVML